LPADEYMIVEGGDAPVTGFIRHNAAGAQQAGK
jgi:hypothetical protein